MTSLRSVPLVWLWVAGLAASMIAPHRLHGQSIPAFSGAEGPGAQATGGRGGDVYHVTNLEADLSGVIPGSLKYGISHAPSAGRTIVFDVGGTIYVPSGGPQIWFRSGNSNITIAGQTAPGGITIAGTGFELFGTNAGEFDTLTIDGVLDWQGGTLDVMGQGGFVPLPSQSFTVLHFGQRQGNVQVRNLTGLAGLIVSEVYDATSLTLPTSALPGDVNLDGVVDGSDFNTWNSHKFTVGGNWLTGDFNGDGATDGTDFNIWNAHKFTSLPGVVPEPCLAMVAVGFLAALRLRSRRVWRHYGWYTE